MAYNYMGRGSDHPNSSYNMFSPSDLTDGINHLAMDERDADICMAEDDQQRGGHAPEGVHIGQSGPWPANLPRASPDLRATQQPRAEYQQPRQFKLPHRRPTASRTFGENTHLQTRDSSSTSRSDPGSSADSSSNTSDSSIGDSNSFHPSRRDKLLRSWAPRQNVVSAREYVRSNAHPVEGHQTILQEAGFDSRRAGRRNTYPSLKSGLFNSYTPSGPRYGNEHSRNSRFYHSTPVLSENLKRHLIEKRQKTSYPDFYSGPGPVHEVADSFGTTFDIHNSPVDVDMMQENNHRPRNRFHDGLRGGGGYRPRDGGGGGGRKRQRDDNDRDDRPARRNRYEEPPASKLRREILVIGETKSRNPVHEAASFGKRIAELFDDDQVRGPFMDTLIELVVEQPFKIPHIAAVILYANDINGSVAQEILVRSSERAQDLIDDGEWRDFKLILRLYACLQSLFEGDGVFAILEELFNRAADQQTASQEDVLGLELVKITLMALPYVMASAATGFEEKAKDLLEKTEIIASVQHPLESLSNPYPVEKETMPFSYVSVLDLLQRQLVREAEDGWKVACLPRLYQPDHNLKSQVKEANGDSAMAEANGHQSVKHKIPVLTIPITLNPGDKPLFPEAHFSVYADQEIESVPKTTDIAASLMRDVVADTINILDFNRNKVASFLIELDCFFAAGTFAPRSVSFDKLKDEADGQSTWKPEDVAIDGVFSQMLQLPSAEHKLVYYHSVITEACKIAPAAIAPTLGRAIRFIYQHVDTMDLELVYRFLDWFTHHLSNFDFRWKWTEWTENVDGLDLDPKKAFIISAIDKEIRLSFAKRVRDTLPQPYHKFITEGMHKETPDFKFEKNVLPYAAEAREIHQLIRKKAPESEIEPHIEAIQAAASENGEMDPLIASTDAYVTAICFLGSKSLSHVLSCIERCKERLLAIGPQSEAARGQIIASVLGYWRDLPGTAVNIIDKLLNYTIVTPESVIRWSLEPAQLGSDGLGLVDVWRYEMVSATMGKVSNRVRQIVNARVSAASAEYTEEQIAVLESTLERERDAMRGLFNLITELVEPYTFHANAETAGWATGWSRVFKRKAVVEESFSGEEAVVAAMAVAKMEADIDAARQKKEDEEQDRRRQEREAEQARREEEEARAKEAEAKAREAEDQASKLGKENEDENMGQTNGGAQELDIADEND